MSTSKSPGKTYMTRSVTKGSQQPGNVEPTEADLGPFNNTPFRLLPYIPPGPNSETSENKGQESNNWKKVKKNSSAQQKHKDEMRNIVKNVLGKSSSSKGEKETAADESHGDNQPFKPDLTKSPNDMDVDPNNDDEHAVGQNKNTNENHNSEHEEDEIIDIEKMAEKPQFKVSCDLAQFPGTNPLSKQNHVKKILSQLNIACFPGRIDTKNIIKEGQDPIKQHLYVFKCADAQAYEKIVKEPVQITIKVKKEDGKLEDKVLTLTFNKVEKKEIPEEVQRNIDEHTIFVNKIPAEMRNYQIRGVFSAYGKIMEGGFKTFMRGQYQSATIIYEDKNSINPFYEKWGVFVNQHVVQVRPKVISEEKLTQRKEYCVKLAGLPNNTTAFDLRGFIDQYQVKYIDIPRNSRFNYPLRHCFVYFDNEENLEIATNKVFSLKGHQLYWVTTDTKTCHRCGIPEHLAKDCDYEDNRPRYKNRKEILKSFKQARQERSKKYKSWAQIAQQGNNFRIKGNSKNNFRPWNQANTSRDNKSREQDVNNFFEQPKHQRQMSMAKNNIYNNSIQYTMNKAMEKLDQLCKTFTVLHNEQQLIKNEITTIKVKYNTKDITKPNTTVNKVIGSNTKGVTKGNGKRILVEDSSDDSPHELSDLEERFQQTEHKTQKMGNDLNDLKNTMQQILQHFQQSNNNNNQEVEGDNNLDEEIIDITQ